MKALRSIRTLVLTVALYAAPSSALPHYVVSDLGPTLQEGYGAPHQIWRLTEKNETILNNNFLAASGAVSLPAGTDLAYGPTAEGYVYVRHNGENRWWHPDGRPELNAPSSIQALSGGGWTAQGLQVGNRMKLFRYAPMTTQPMEVYQTPVCDPDEEYLCSIRATGASNAGDTLSAWEIVPPGISQETESGVMSNSSQLASTCAAGPMGDNGAFIYATSCTGQIQWIYSASGTVIPALPGGGSVNWTALNGSNEIVGQQIDAIRSYGILSFNSDTAKLEDLIPVGTGYQIFAAYAINEKGSILAVGYRNGNFSDPRALLLTESPLVVNVSNDNTDMNLADGICDGSPDAGEQCSLRAAIQQANYSPGPTEVRFAIPGAGIPVISLARELPEIEQTISLLGTTQPGGQVAIDGSRTGSGSSGLTLTNARESVVTGLRIFGFDINGINIFLGGGSKIQGNILGLSPNGQSQGFGGYGIFIADSSDNDIGGIGAGEGNVIANAGISGVSIEGGSLRNSVLSNRIFGNARLGIDLANDGATSNHGIGVATGPNFLQNAPTLTSVSNGIVQGTLEAEPLHGYRIEIFSSECSGNRGQGQTFLGAVDVATDTKGKASFQLSVVGTGALTATATDRDGNTSEFSPIVLADSSVGGACITTTELKTKNSVFNDGRGKLNFQCPFGGTCSGTLVLQYLQKNDKSLRASRAKYITIVSKTSFTSKSNGKITVSYSLTKKGKALLKQKGKLSAVAVVSAKDQSGIRSGSTFKVLIRSK